MELFDTDGNGTMEFDELIGMLLVDPWRELMPSGPRTKENAQLMMRNFTQLDMILIDGDPNMLPWHEEMEDVLQLVFQVTITTESKPKTT